MVLACKCVIFFYTLQAVATCWVATVWFCEGMDGRAAASQLRSATYIGPIR